MHQCKIKLHRDDLSSMQLLPCKWKGLDSHAQASECPECVGQALSLAQLDVEGTEYAGSEHIADKLSHWLQLRQPDEGWDQLTGPFKLSLSLSVTLSLSLTLPQTRKTHACLQTSTQCELCSVRQHRGCSLKWNDCEQWTVRQAVHII